MRIFSYVFTDILRLKNSLIREERGFFSPLVSLEVTRNSVELPSNCWRNYWLVEEFSSYIQRSSYVYSPRIPNLMVLLAVNDQNHSTRVQFFPSTFYPLPSLLPGPSGPFPSPLNTLFLQHIHQSNTKSKQLEISSAKSLNSFIVCKSK